MSNPTFDKGIDITVTYDPFGFVYGEGVFGPEAELRRLDDIRTALLDPQCSGPDVVYAIAMDVGKTKHRSLLTERRLLFGVVAYASGRLGHEPVRSQGHIHKESIYSRFSTPEVYEIWSGQAVIYMQEYAEDNPGKCYAVYAGPGDVVIVPPYWAHATISANAEEPLVFGAWCDRDYGFEYEGIRKYKGIAWFPLYNQKNELQWIPNINYRPSELIQKYPESYVEWGIEKGKSIYKTFEDNPDTFLYVSNPLVRKESWTVFKP